MKSGRHAISELRVNKHCVVRSQNKKRSKLGGEFNLNSYSDSIQASSIKNGSFAGSIGPSKNPSSSRENSPFSSGESAWKVYLSKPAMYNEV